MTVFEWVGEGKTAVKRGKEAGEEPPLREMAVENGNGPETSPTEAWRA